MKKFFVIGVTILVVVGAWCISGKYAFAQVVTTEASEAQKDSLADSEKMPGDISVCILDSVAPECVIPEILSRNPGRTVLIDLWATWCGPCRMGHQTMAELKTELKGEPVVFAYLTNPSSPYQMWMEMIKQIPGQHYYLTREQFSYILSELYHSQGIPTYALYAPDGTLAWQHVGYMPTNDELRKAIAKHSKLANHSGQF